ncbi:MAG TPA: tol-pal system protein YbgF [Casimicrobiaceae bacterium]|nr:tol-pal system protein YbgF [Casimicrobiaceae bacterium]
MKRTHLAAAAVTIFLVVHGAQAALFDDEEARRRIESTNVRLTQLQRQIEDRVTALEQRMQGQGLADLANQLQLLQGDIAKLRGQIEVVTYELEQAQKRQRDLYVDLDTRLRKIESAAASAAEAANAANAANGANPANAASAGTAAPNTAPGPDAAAPGAPPRPTSPPAAVPVPPGPVATAPPVRNPSDGVAEQRAYDAALDLFKRGDYAGSITGFNAFLKAYPRSPLAASAQYWIGNAQYARRDYRGSIATQRQLLKEYPDSSKAPDALLNIASAQADMGDNAAARRSLEELMAKYPKSDAATRARQRLGVR